MFENINTDYLFDYALKIATLVGASVATHEFLMNSLRRAIASGKTLDEIKNTALLYEGIALIGGGLLYATMRRKNPLLANIGLGVGMGALLFLVFTFRDLNDLIKAVKGNDVLTNVNMFTTLLTSSLANYTADYLKDEIASVKNDLVNTVKSELESELKEIRKQLAVLNKKVEELEEKQMGQNTGLNPNFV